MYQDSVSNYFYCWNVSFFYLFHVSEVKSLLNLLFIIHTEWWRGYYGLVDIGYDKHFRINHGKNTFNLHLKECELMFNHIQQNLYAITLELVRNNPRLLINSINAFISGLV